MECPQALLGQARKLFLKTATSLCEVKKATLLRGASHVLLVVLLPDGDTRWHPLVRKRPTPLWVVLRRLECALLSSDLQGRGGDTKDYPY